MLSNVQKIFEILRSEAGDVGETEEIYSGAESQANIFSTEFRAICLELGLDNLTVHSLRHTFSTRADKFNVGVFHQKALLGHSKLAMTDRYTHVSKEP